MTRLYLYLSLSLSPFLSILKVCLLHLGKLPWVLSAGMCLIYIVTFLQPGLTDNPGEVLFILNTPNEQRFLCISFYPEVHIGMDQ